MKPSKNNVLNVLEQSSLSFKLIKLETNEILNLKFEFHHSTCTQNRSSCQ